LDFFSYEFDVNFLFFCASVCKVFYKFSSPIHVLINYSSQVLELFSTLFHLVCHVVEFIFVWVWWQLPVYSCIRPYSVLTLLIDTLACYIPLKNISFINMETSPLQTSRLKLFWWHHNNGCLELLYDVIIFWHKISLQRAAECIVWMTIIFLLMIRFSYRAVFCKPHSLSFYMIPHSWYSYYDFFIHCFLWKIDQIFQFL
jgi:hypothetical protein